MSELEKIIYEPLRSILKPEFDIELIKYRWLHFYFLELRYVLRSEIRVSEQLEMFKQGLKVKNRFLQRTSQVSRQIKAQAVVAFVIYGLIFTLSYYQLRLADCLFVIICSIVLFGIGIFLIFRIGGTIKWKI